ncbi:hypothetical protein DSD19_04495 [Rhodovulum sp. BSW8]|uniref:hypothetical protein n=1 Tax=Rhodovulum sp. BSW8 TaxID=2259645 RepID=UPI000DE467B3|nr:hypothetical protein [Rhodovulum sp. BSW8]RBO54641.1 hypothetical protein DSD19_04495 [Rhodovulum sp. BSW8]
MLSIDSAPILGTAAAVEGNELNATAGSVSGGSSVRTWQWYRGSDAISDATEDSYVLTEADIGHQIKVRQIETPSGGSPVTRDSTASPVVVALNFQARDNGDGTFGVSYADGARSTVEFVLSQPMVYAGSFSLDLAALETGPVCLVQPALSGTPALGETLSGLPFLWVYQQTLGALTITSRWLRNGTVITGETGPTHEVVAADVANGLSYGEVGTQSGAAAPVAAATEGIQISGTVVASLTAVSGARTASGQVSVAVTTNRSAGSIFYVITSGAAPSAAQIVAGQDAAGEAVAAPYAGSRVVSAAGQQTLTISGLAEPISATVYLVQKQDASDALSNVAATAQIVSPSSSGYSPRSSASAVAWWDASDEATITHTAGAIGQISDKIGSAHLTGTGTTGVAASDVNGLNTVVMDGVIDRLETDAIAFPDDGNWVLSLVVYIGEVDNILDSLFQTLGAGSTVNAYMSAASDAYFRGRFYFGQENAFPSVEPVSGLHCVQILADKSNSVARFMLNGAQVAGLAYPTALDATMLRLFRFGESRGLGGRFCEGILDGDTATQSPAHDYLKLKWDL